MFGQISVCLNVEQEEIVVNGLEVSQDIVLGEKTPVGFKLLPRQRFLPYSLVRLALLLNGTWLHAFTTVLVYDSTYMQ